MLRDLDWVFAYGTLRPGGGNFEHLLQGNIEQVFDNAVINGFDMYSRGSYPVIVPVMYKNSQIFGTLMQIKKDKLSKVMSALDRLEGYSGPGKSNHYERVVVQVNYLSQSGKSTLTPLSGPAWVYIGGKEAQKQYAHQQGQRLVHGDWRKHTSLPSEQDFVD